MTAVQAPKDTTAAMEDIHGVDVSWLHHSTRGETRFPGAPPPAVREERRGDESLTNHSLPACRPPPPTAGALVAGTDPRCAAQDVLARRPAHAAAARRAQEPQTRP
jgi:hypothetical protein